MKGIIIVLLLIVAGIAVFYYASSSTDEGFDPTQQGREARAAVEVGASWTEVIAQAGQPRKWRDATSDFDFVYTDEFNEDARAQIAQQLEKGELTYGFSFLYRFSDVVTFAVNFNNKGKVINIQDKESKADLMDMGED
jgi:hypothetical protein